MAGGLFGRPFVLNIKCIVFSLICMMLFLYKPSLKNDFTLYTTLFIIFVISYVAMAWYDYYYDCRINPLKRGGKSFTGMFKPPAHMPEKQIEHKETKKDTQRNNMLIYLSHILFITPILVYLAVYKHNTHPNVYPIVGALAGFTLLYHGGKAVYASHNF